MVQQLGLIAISLVALITAPKQTTAFVLECDNDNYVDLVPSGSYCYLFTNETGNFAKAVEMCNSLQGEVITNIESEEINRAIINEAGRIVWLDVTRQSRPNYVWLDESPTENPNFEDNSSGNNCGVADGQQEGKWSTEDCKTLLPTFCQVEKVPARGDNPDKCPNSDFKNIVTGSRYCYKFIPFSSNWQVMENYCKALNSEMVGNIYRYFYDFIIGDLITYAVNELGPQNNRFWLGMKNYEFTWADNYAISLYSNWAIEEPEEGYDCGAMFGSGDWAAFPCDNEFEIACQVPKSGKL